LPLALSRSSKNSDIAKNTPQELKFVRVRKQAGPYCLINIPHFPSSTHCVHFNDESMIEIFDLIQFDVDWIKNLYFLTSTSKSKLRNSQYKISQSNHIEMKNFDHLSSICISNFVCHNLYSSDNASIYSITSGCYEIIIRALHYKLIMSGLLWTTPRTLYAYLNLIDYTEVGFKNLIGIRYEQGTIYD